MFKPAVPVKKNRRKKKKKRVNVVTKRPVVRRPPPKIDVRPTATTPRPIPIPGVDFDFFIPPKNPIIEEPEDEYEYDYKNYDDYKV